MKKQNIIASTVIFFALIIFAVLVKGQNGTLTLSLSRLAGSTTVFFIIPLILVLITPLRKKVTVTSVFSLALVLSITLALINPKQSTESINVGDGERSDMSQVTNPKPLTEWLKNYQRRIQIIFSNFNQEQEKADIFSRILPDSLIDTNIAKTSKQVITQLEAQIPEFENAILKEMQLAEIYLSSQKGQEATQVYYGYLETKDKGADRIHKYFQAQRDLLLEYMNILDIAIESEGKIHLAGNQLMFESEQNMTRYNNHINEIQRLSVEVNNVLTN